LGNPFVILPPTLPGTPKEGENITAIGSGDFLGIFLFCVFSNLQEIFVQRASPQESIHFQDMSVLKKICKTAAKKEI